MSEPVWDETDSATFVDRGADFVPARATQIAAIRDLVPATAEPFAALDLCCGEGLLAEAILERHPRASVLALDGSTTMLERAGERNGRFGERFRARRFALEDAGWRSRERGPLAELGDLPLRAVVSSLAIHHLDGEGKRRLYRDLFALLAPGGALLVADLVAPASGRAEALAARAWDDAVAARGADAADAFREERWNLYRHGDPLDRPSPLFDQLRWLHDAGYVAVDVYWLHAGHAVYGGRRPPLDDPPTDWENQPASREPRD